MSAALLEKAARLLRDAQPLFDKDKNADEWLKWVLAVRAWLREYDNEQ